MAFRFYRRLKHGHSTTLLSEMGADLLFCPFTAPNYAEPGIPLVSTIYDLQYKTYPEFFKAADLANREHVFVSACHNADHLVAISEYSRQKAMEHSRLTEEKISTIYLQMAQRILSKEEEDTQVLERLALTPQHYLLYPANFWKHKNHEMLFLAFETLCANGLDKRIKLVCTGAPGRRQTALMEMVSRMHMKGRVIFPGFLSNQAIGTLMAHARGVVFPSLYEGFGLPVIEAMAAGIPVACSQVTSLPEVVGEAALLFDPRDQIALTSALDGLLHDEELRNTLVQRGQERATHFSDARCMAEEYWSLFNKVYHRFRSEAKIQ